MSRHYVKLDDRKYIAYGYDAPCQGYFAELHVYDDKIDKIIMTDEVGFFQGVSKNKILEFFEKHGAIEVARSKTPDAFNKLIGDLPC